MCETCLAMTTGLSTPNESAAPPPPAFLDGADFAAQLETNRSADVEAPPENPFERPFQPVHSFYQPEQTPAPEYRSKYQLSSPPSQPPPLPPPNPSQYSPTPRRAAPQTPEREYEPSVRYWITELPTFAKIGLAVVIFSVCFAVILKSSLLMDLTPQPTGATPLARVNTPNLEPQKLWFSGWFRSEPTAEEIFEQFETVTNSAGKKLASETFILTGKGQFLPVEADGKPDLVAYKKNLPPGEIVHRIEPRDQEVFKNTPRPQDFAITFELSLKSPDKLLMQMTMKPKKIGGPDFLFYTTAGFDGVKGWSIMKTQVGGKVTVNEGKAPGNTSYFNQTQEGISMTFAKSMYRRIEYRGEQVVFNRKSYWLKVTTAFGKDLDIFFDQETGLATKVIDRNMEAYILAYREYNGMQVPAKMVYQSGGEWLLMTIEEIKADVPLDDNIFQRSSYQ